MNVYFLGKRLSETIQLLRSILNVNININSKPKKTTPSSKFLVLHYMPSEIINGSIKYNPVSMPSCDLYKNDSNNRRCRYDLIPVSVYFNERIKDSDDMMDIIRRLRFPSLKGLIDLYDEYLPKIKNLNEIEQANEKASESLEGIYNEIACKWLKQNKNIYNPNSGNSWFKTVKLRTISIGGMWVVIRVGC